MLRALLLVSLIFAAPVAAQTTANNPELAAIAESLRDSADAPGAAVMVMDGGEVRIGVAGVRALGQTPQITPDDLWHIGSDTKAMTATLVARLVEQGVVSWDDTIGERLGGVIEDIDPAYAGLSFRHLLSHRAGIAANVGRFDMVRFVMEGADGRPMPQQRIDYAGKVLGQPPAATPETEFLYSNAGYVVAGAMLDQATGESWETLLTREVFEPLGMASAGFGAPGSASVIDQPRGHRSGMFGGFNAIAPGPGADNPPVMGPAGTVHISLTDLARYMAAHMAGERGEETAFLSNESWHTLHTPPFGGNYALGWGLDDGVLAHAGSNTMWLVQIVMDPSRDLGVVIAFNDGRTDRLMPLARAEIAELMDSEAAD
tara:strand:- start:6686 stop:7804 length:1119 start_codon:yes stop_codon:yes gene_type:complete